MIMDKVLVTGIDGFVGSNLIKFFKDTEFIFLTPSRKVLNLNNQSQLKKYFIKNKPKFIINLASRTVPKINSEVENNKQKKNTIDPLVNICLTSPSSVKLIIGIGTIEEYGNQFAPFKENMSPCPLSSYAKAKYKSFKYLRNICEKKKIKYVWLRPSLMFGNNMQNSRLIKLIINSYKNKKKLIIKNPNSVRDHLYVDDFCLILILMLQNTKLVENKIINISNENWITNKKLIDKFSKILKKKSKISFSSKTHNEKMNNLSNSGLRFKKIFKNFKFTSFDRAILDTAKYYKITK